jgi:hypothetical protein
MTGPTLEGLAKVVGGDEVEVARLDIHQVGKRLMLFIAAMSMSCKRSEPAFLQGCAL